MSSALDSSNSDPNSFFWRSRSALRTEILKNIHGLDLASKLGIFGTANAAVFLHQVLKEVGFTRISFLSSNPPAERLCDVPLLRLNVVNLDRLDAVICSSLASSSEQKRALIAMGFNGKVIELSDLHHISPNLFEDHATTQRLLDLKDIHKGEIGFVVGNGPSLNQTDPTKVMSIGVTFAGNGIVNHKTFEPDYYCALDATALQHWGKRIAINKSRKLFSAKLRETILSHYPKVESDDHLYFPNCYSHKSSLNIDQWPELGFEAGGTIICPMLQIAAWLGCDPICLLGVDLSHDKLGNHFSEDYFSDSFKGYSPAQLTTFRQRLPQGINRSIRACQARGHTVINLAPVNRFDSVERIEFDRFLQKVCSDPSGSI